MFSCMILSKDESEMQPLILALRRMNVEAIVTVPSYSNYLKTLQYQPDLILIELTPKWHDQLHYIQSVKQHKSARHIPIFGYGNVISEEMQNGITGIGVDQYFERPLKDSGLFDFVRQNIREKMKTAGYNITPTKAEKAKDIKTILSAKTDPDLKLQLIIKHISSLLAFPFAVSQIIQIATDEKSDAEQLGKAIQVDPVISANILKIANSVLFAANNREISTIKEAIVRVGFDETKRIVMGVSVLQTVDTEYSHLGFNRKNFWLHCLGSAIVAEHFASSTDGVSSDQAFLAGLLHDFATILLDEFFPKIFAYILKTSTDQGARFFSTSKDILGLSLYDIVKELFTQWKLPSNIIEAIVNHHTILNDESAVTTPTHRLSVLTSVGNILAKCIGLGASCDQFVNSIPDWAFTKIGAKPYLTENDIAQIKDKFEFYRTSMKIEVPNENMFSPIENNTEALTFSFKDIDSGAYFAPIAYLKSKGHTVAEMQEMNVQKLHTAPSDAILLHIGDNTKPDEISAIAELENDPGFNTPVVMFLSNNSTLCSYASEHGISTMQDGFDLRIFDYTLDEVVQGNQISIINNETETDKKINLLNAEISILRSQCESKNIENDDLRQAVEFIKTAQAAQSDGIEEEADQVAQLAAAYYRLALSKYRFEIEKKRIEKMAQLKAVKR